MMILNNIQQRLKQKNKHVISNMLQTKAGFSSLLCMYVYMKLWGKWKSLHQNRVVNPGSSD